MSKKTLGIILVVLIIVIAGMVYFGFEKSLFTGKDIGIGGIGKKSIMDAAREQGQIAPSKTDALKECEKAEDQEDKDLCYGMLAFYYRDASFCKEIKDPEIKKRCNKENIEKWYSDLEKGGPASPFMPGGLIPGGGIIPVGETGGGTDIILSDTSIQTEPGADKSKDEQCVDVMAHQLWASQLMLARHDMATAMIASQKAETLQKQYGMSDEDFENICNARVGDMDFMDHLEKRMRELGFVMK